MTTPASEPTREAFEAAVAKAGVSQFEVDEGGLYLSATTHFALVGWQAAHSHARAEMEARDANVMKSAERLIDEMLGAQSRFAGLWRDSKPVTNDQRRLAIVRDEARAKLMRLIGDGQRATLAEPQPTGAGEG